MSVIEGYNGYAAAINLINTPTDYGQGSAAPSGQQNTLQNSLVAIDRDSYAQMLQVNAQDQQANLGFINQMSSMFGMMMERMMGMVEKMGDAITGLVAKRPDAQAVAPESTPTTTPTDPAKPAETEAIPANVERKEILAIVDEFLRRTDLTEDESQLLRDLGEKIEDR